MRRIALLSVCWIALALALPAQNVIPRMGGVTVFENGDQLRNPSAGGFNVPEFSAIDLDLDGTDDLMAFDRSGYKVVTFLNHGTANQVDYHFAPEYAAAFPTDITDFALCADFDCDGKKDLFYGINSRIKVLRNTSTPGNLSFQLYRDTLLTDYGAGPALIFLYQGDIPALVDVDGDEDLDVLAYNPGGTTVEWHKNMVKENTGSCAGLEMEVADRCWGRFQESGLNQSLTLGITCRTAPGAPIPGRPQAHSGSTIAAFDEDADGDYELVIGDLLYDGLTYCHNNGTPTAADVDSVDVTFPSYDASVALDIFAAGYFVDVNNDGKLDMIAAPNGTNVSVNYDNSWYYQNIDPGNGVVLTREKKNFLTDEMIDVGLGAYPAFFDANADGLTDLVIGTQLRKISASNEGCTLVLYENTGTASVPVFTLTNRNYGSLNNVLTGNLNGLTPAFGDMDGDGDEDLVLGDIDGHLHYLQNTAATGQPASFPTAQQNYLGIDIGQFAAPAIADIDGDGKKDLIVGEFGGTLNYFRNIGTAQSPSFSATPDDANWGGIDVQPLCCTGFSMPTIFVNPEHGRLDLVVGSEKGDLFYYRDFQPELGGSFTLDQANFGEIREGGRTAIAGRDLTGDGVWEWAVGNVRGGIGFYSGNGLLTGLHPEPASAPVGWEAYPNPTAGRIDLRLEAGHTGTMHCEVMDLQGRVLRSARQSAAATAHMDIADLSPGIYLLRLELNGRFVGVKRIELMR